MVNEFLRPEMRLILSGSWPSAWDFGLEGAAQRGRAGSVFRAGEGAAAAVGAGEQAWSTRARLAGFCRCAGGARDAPAGKTACIPTRRIRTSFWTKRNPRTSGDIRSGQHAPVSVLGLAHRGPAHRAPAKRDQGRRGIFRGLLPGARTTPAVPARHERLERGPGDGDCREISLAPPTARHRYRLAEGACPSRWRVPISTSPVAVSICPWSARPLLST